MTKMKMMSKRLLFLASLLLIAICLVIPLGEARQSGGWGCDEGCADSCVSSAEAFEAACGSSPICADAAKNELCSCINRRNCGRSCQVAQSCPNN